MGNVIYGENRWIDFFAFTTEPANQPVEESKSKSPTNQIDELDLQHLEAGLSVLESEVSKHEAELKRVNEDLIAIGEQMRKNTFAQKNAHKKQLQKLKREYEHLASQKNQLCARKGQLTLLEKNEIDQKRREIVLIRVERANLLKKIPQENGVSDRASQ